MKVVLGSLPVNVSLSPPACAEHEGSHVVRDGRYSKSSERKRQRYRCYPVKDDREVFHSFTPLLPRNHVHEGTETCALCEEHRGVHRGDQAVSRRQSWSARVVADALRDLARGQTYAAVAKRAWDATGRTRTRRVASTSLIDEELGPDYFAADDDASTSQRVYSDAELSRNRWHTAADWVEVFGPVLWENLDSKLRRKAAERAARRDQQRAAGERTDDLMVVVIDSVPVYQRSGISSRQKQLYQVLVLSEVEWRRGSGGAVARTHKLRLIRAFPTADYYSWKMLLSELGYVPDAVVSDYASAQHRAVRDSWSKESIQPVLIPSVWHIMKNVEAALVDKAISAQTMIAASDGDRQLRPEFREQLSSLSLANLLGDDFSWWHNWWDELIELVAQVEAPLDPVLARRQIHEHRLVDALRVAAVYPEVPLSTAGVEVANRSKIAPILENRGHAFANLERTNRLFDLVVCDDHGIFNNMTKVIEQIRADSTAADGWSAPLRAISDSQGMTDAIETKRYASLRDPLLIREAARRTGVA